MGFDYTALSKKGLGIPDGWCVVAVGDVSSINELSIQSGYPHKTIDYIDIASVEKGDIHSVQMLALSDAPSRAKRIIRDNDILISTVRPNLEHHVFIKRATPNTIASTGFAAVTARNVDPRYLYYYLTTKPFTAYLSQIADSHTSAYPAINPDVIETAELLLPPSDEQRAIAHILGTLDDKIALNRQMNQTLEAMAQALFKSWFVDFEPFRDQGMQNSPLGEIPAGWTVVCLSELGEIVCGKTPPTADVENYSGNIPFVTIPDMHSKVFIKRTATYLSEKGAATQPKKLLPKNSVCVSCIATPGLAAITSEPSHTNQQINSIMCDRAISPYWCYLAIRNIRQEIITGGAGGSATLNLNKAEFSKLQVIKPDSGTMKKFHNLMEPILSQILSNDLQSITLSSMRDALLPKLLSGEIRVKDAEFMESKL